MYLFSQKNFQIFSINENLNFVKQVELNENNISAFDLGNQYLVYASEGKLNIYNYISKIWKKKNLIALNDFELKIASANHTQVLTKKDINCVKVDNKRNKVGFTLRYGLFKDFDINSLNKVHSEWNAAGNQIVEFNYSHLKDEYVIFYKFYPDSISMMGNLKIFKRVDLNAGTFFYKDQAGIDMVKVRTLSFNTNESVYGGIRADSCLWLWNKNNSNEINNFVVDNQKLRSFSFINNDSIALLYNDFISISTIKKFSDHSKVKFILETQPILSGFCYNNERSFFIGQTQNDLILFTLNKDHFEIQDKIKIKDGKIISYKICENGKNLAILFE